MTSHYVAPDWFAMAEEANPRIFERIASATCKVQLPLHVSLLPRQAFWFLVDSMQLANGANREGMHANALSITRQCLEAISIVELGLAQSEDAAGLLERWEADKVSASELRKWLEENIWVNYGAGLWSETWADFMGKLCKAIQPYAHYSPKLAQWQSRLANVPDETESRGTIAILECGPHTYDPQKASRVTFFHALISFALARIWIANSRDKDPAFEELLERLRIVLRKSHYLDGDHTNWDEQFWAMPSSKDGNNCPE